MFSSLGVRSLALMMVLAHASSGCKGKAADAETAAGEDAPAESEAGGSSTMTLPVAGAPVRRGDLVLSVTTTGQVRSDAMADLRAETNGAVDEVRVRPGQAVKQGDVLVKLDQRPFDLAVREAEAALAEARIRYRGNLASDSILLGPGQEEERRQNALTLSGVPGAQVRLERAELERERSVITAPFDGVIERVDVAAGSRVSAGGALVTMVDVTNLRIEAQVLEHDLPYIKVGGDAFISAPALAGGPVKGLIVAVLPLVDTVARAGKVIIAASAGGRLRPGMYTDLKLEATRLPDRTLVPARAVIERDGRPLVFVAREGRAQWVYIVPGKSNGTDTEVLPDSSTGTIPVVAGDTVLVEGHLTLTHDAPVREVNAAERAQR